MRILKRKLLMIVIYFFLLSGGLIGALPLANGTPVASSVQKPSVNGQFEILYNDVNSVNLGTIGSTSTVS